MLGRETFRDLFLHVPLKDNAKSLIWWCRLVALIFILRYATFEHRSTADLVWYLLVVPTSSDIRLPVVLRQRNCQIAGPRARSFNSIVPC